MSVRSQDWYDLNESRLWPLDDTAKLSDDSGQFLANDIIADLYIRFPAILGDRAFISTLTISKHIVTITFLGTAAGFTPMASVSLPRPVDPHRHYEVEALYPGVGGWVVFGDGINDIETRSYKFSDPLQTLLLAQTARRYSDLPVKSIGLQGANSNMTGLVKLLGGNDVTTKVEERFINGVLRDVIVISLLDKTEDDTVRNLLELYAGVCGQRPESGNCGDPEPIQFVNTVSPDCCGNISLEFRGCADLSAIEGQCGVVIDCGFGLSNACVTPDHLPDDTGKLPNEYDDQCIDASESVDISVPPEDPEDYVLNSRDLTGSTLPYTENFSDAVADDLTIIAGEFVIVTGGNGSGAVVDITSSSGNTEVQFATAPPNQLPAIFTISGNSVTGYNVTHVVTGVVNNKTVVTDQTYTADGAGGSWQEVASGGAGAAGIVFEAQEDRENIALWDQNLPVGFDTLHKRVETILSIKVGSAAARDNGGIVLNYKDNDNYWLVEIDWNDFKTLSVLHKNKGAWQIRASIQVPALDQHNRYRLSAEILPMDEAGGSTSAIVDAKLEGLDDGTEYLLPDVVLPEYLPATGGRFGLYSNRSLTWFEEITVSDHNP